ncbi:unnamed protein product [Penicillium salamii]|uniref:Uncharacterized protein n=1 Tax=Penicillium salamii TaxID=1612424 RepID=A0A9W4JBY2_9EURO|nr:unnamed protein product [Penicillium salamii]CAG8094348.1 unnamed protein product [Penicillium salamii]CAG8097059.1 unnamed protein product [Penicillium salamii]CAG8139929.1 unnamed protein product [Penicillium salamii]CAG8192793.1 unnamed protein product [Penicillium salamii]
MCHHTYHHYPSCGHISNWSITSCQEYTNKLRLAGPDRSALCEAISTSHDLLQSTQPSMCIRCESEWASSITEGRPQKVYQAIEGMSHPGCIFEIEARMVSTLDCNSEIDTDDKDGEISLYAISGSGKDSGFSSAGDGSISAPGSKARTARILDMLDCTSDSDESDDGGSVCSDSNSEQYYSFYDDSSSVDDEDSCRSPCDRPGCCADTCATIPSLPPLDWDSLNLETFGLHDSNILAEITVPVTNAQSPQTELPAKISNREDDLPEIDLSSIQERIETSVRRRLDEHNEKKTQEKNLSQLLDAALLEKDKNDRREREAAQGIEEDPHLWDTESINDLFTRTAGPLEIYEDASDVSPRTQVKARGDSPRSGPQPTMHIYRGTMFAATEEQAYQNGLRDIRPYLNHEGQWEGQMRAFSADDATDMGLFDAVHIRGCCDVRPLEWHAYYGMMQADSESEAEQRHLENIQIVPGSNNQFYGSILAEDLAHARAMGVSNPQHLWGCCVDGQFDMPLAVKHQYNGTMSAISLDDAADKGLLDVQAMSGENNGLYYGHVVVECELEAWNMGLREIKHADGCDGCAAAEPVEEMDALLPNPTNTFFGYMFGHTEQDVIDRGLQHALLVPGYTKKYSGNLQAGSAEEANAMGLIGASRIEWGLLQG